MEKQRSRHPFVEAVVIGVPLVGLGILAMVLSDEAKWSQVLGAAALLGFMALMARAQMTVDREDVRRGRLPAWAVGRWRYFLLAVAVVVGFIIGQD